MKARKNMTIEEILDKYGVYIETVSGDSMMPLLRQGKDKVKIIKSSGVLKKGDLPLYRRPSGQCVLHRIQKVKKGYYIICGDNRTIQEKVPFEWVIGMADSIIKDGREISFESAEYRNYVRRVQLLYVPRSFEAKIKNRLVGIAKHKDMDQ